MTKKIEAIVRPEKVNDVKRALLLDEALQKFADDSKTLSREAFAQSYARFLTDVSGNLQTTGAIDHGE